jgi:CxxC-x17-CxxC domain-containing protein
MSQKRMFDTKCSECNNPVSVPFKPTAGKPVYCRPCYNKRNEKQRNGSGTTNMFNMKNAWAMCKDNGNGQKTKTSSVFQKK